MHFVKQGKPCKICDKAQGDAIRASLRFSSFTKPMTREEHEKTIPPS